jgi:8-oxo-dGTP pyrophosphatase MutT (NUDIX family)
MPDSPTLAFVRDFPMKYMSAAALFFDERGALLIVKPTYKDGWEIPGGIVEADESPMQACRREIREEIGLTVTVGPLLVMDYKSRGNGLSDSLQFVFLGGALAPAQIQAITLPETELSEHRFLPPDEALATLPSSLSLRVAGGLRAIAEGRTLLLHDGHEET